MEPLSDFVGERRKRRMLKRIQKSEEEQVLGEKELGN